MVPISHACEFSFNLEANWCSWLGSWINRWVSWVHQKPQNQYSAVPTLVSEGSFQTGLMVEIPAWAEGVDCLWFKSWAMADWSATVVMLVHALQMRNHQKTHPGHLVPNTCFVFWKNLEIIERMWKNLKRFFWEFEDMLFHSNSSLLCLRVYLNTWVNNTFY